MIHIGFQKTLTTLCGKPVARRWWVEARHVEHGRYGPLLVFRVVEPVGATCKRCLQLRAPEKEES